MENKRGSEIFLGVVGVATLLVAIIGATFAYFSATAKSGNEAVHVQAATLSLGYGESDETKLLSAMIPAHYGIAKTAAFKERTQDICVDDNGNQVCSIYKFRIGNPSATTKMTIEGSIKSVKNEFTNLSFAIWKGDIDRMDDITSLDDPLLNATLMPASGETQAFGFKQDLIGFSGVAGGADFKEKNPFTYASPEDISTGTNVVDYTMLIWINEAGEDNVAEAGKMFTATVTFNTTASSEGQAAGVTGIIAGAMEDKFTPTTPEPQA